MFPAASLFATELSGQSNVNLGLDMDVESPRGSRRIRARIDGQVDHRTQRSVFRIEDESGQVLRRIHDARHSQEALALYWRIVGAGMPEAMMGKDLARRISHARALLRREGMQTPELPFETDPPADEAEPAPGGDGTPSRAKRRPKRVSAPVPQTDLFGEETAASVDAPPVEAAGLSEPIPAETTPAPEPLFKPEPPSRPEPRLVDAQAVMLQQVDSRNLRATDRADSYLYHVTNGPDAETALRNGLTVSASDPMILTERQGVGYWLSMLAEDYDYIMDGPANFVVLRMRRLAVEELLEHDPHASRSAGCPCYLLTGGAASREHDEAARHR